MQWEVDLTDEKSVQTFVLDIRHRSLAARAKPWIKKILRLKGTEQTIEEIGQLSAVVEQDSAIIVS